MSNPSGRNGTGPGKRQLSGLGGIVPCTGKGGGSSKNQSSKKYMSSQNWTGNKGSQDITIFDTKILVKDVERVLDASPPDPVEIEMAKKMLKEQEQSLIDAIARIGDVSDSESGNTSKHILLLNMQCPCCIVLYEKYYLSWEYMYTKKNACFPIHRKSMKDRLYVQLLGDHVNTRYIFLVTLPMPVPSSDEMIEDCFRAPRINIKPHRSHKHTGLGCHSEVTRDTFTN
ncbi:hypothetical protein BHE74_00034816 [Ensete ventricosum]|nr:hypothetical protein BHE74_00034816 [Ensete ventricosum]